jgi:hypothetical protein
VLIYDTFHSKPLSIIQGLHYANLVDATWSADGHTLVVCSTDGYVSLIQFAAGELGQVYHRPAPPPIETTTTTTTPVVVAKTKARITLTPTSSAAPLPTCEPGPTVVMDVRPTKKAKRVVPTLLSSSVNTNKRPADDTMAAAVDKLTLASTTTTTTNSSSTEPSSLITILQPKKKKRIQPTLLAEE